ncbi:MAG TPA: thiamine diphosphokinase [Candidatus Limnocylindrales bacterium]|nr:thiamine diphosphokinase [Candidatus Limnocylindrales bacterium]
MTAVAPLHALIAGDGDGPDRARLDAAWPGWDDDVRLVVAADGGARLAERLGLRIDHWVGDGDSLDSVAIERLRQSGIPVDLVSPAKDESDLELALGRAVALGATRVTILGALGGQRLDHTLANVALLAHPALAGRDACLLDAATRVSLVTGPATARIDGRRGDLVSLLPVSGDVAGITTEGLEYSLHDEPLVIGPARGLSNVRLGTTASVTVRTGRLLVVEVPATLGP